ncbi:YidC/Oxa1 family membrane protein insertase [Candidatus Saccharibacteria bacterium]|nr:YidC/Oxa1 family membrane protein insertase [Candidatus Saccharibacteria bacterium]
MDKKSLRKYIYWGIFILFVIGSIFAGGPFPFIDIIIVRPIVNILFVIFNLVHDFGLAIIIFTILVKLLMLPLTKRQLRQTRLIRRIQPELTQIRKNCNGNKQLESLQTMDLYKRYNIKPFASILTLIIQLPLFVALFSAIRVIATPMPQDNLSNRAYGIIAYEGSEIRNLQDKQQAYFDKLNSLSDEEKKNLTEEQKKELEYDFHPQLFGVINLEAKASDLLRGFSWSAFAMLIFAIAAAVVQFYMTKQQMPSGKSEKKKKFRDLIKEAEQGKDIDQAEINAMSTAQMSKMMPIMMFVIMINLHGALAFYYFLSNVMTVIQQKIVLKKIEREMDDATDKAMLKELKNIKEAEIIENKKTGTKIKRVSAKDIKKKRR